MSGCRLTLVVVRTAALMIVRGMLGVLGRPSEAAAGSIDVVAGPWRARSTTKFGDESK